jgi:hypothetical protein
VSKPHLEPKTRLLLLSDSCGFVGFGGALSDEYTGILFIIASVACQYILRSESRGTHEHILLSQIEDSVRRMIPTAKSKLS